MATSPDAPVDPSGSAAPLAPVAPLSTPATSPSATSVPVRSPSRRVPDKTGRRFFSADDKRRIVLAFQACSSPEERGAFVRREGVYYSQVTDWVGAFQRGGLDALRPKKPGRALPPLDPAAPRLRELEKELALWKARAERAEALCEVQKKVSTLLGLLSLPSNDRP